MATNTPTSTPSPANPIPPLSTTAPSSVDDMIAHMTLEQKIGQTLILGFDGQTLDPELRAEIMDLHPGGYILYDRNVQSPQQVAQLDVELQEAARTNGDPTLFLTIDQEGGVVTRFPENKGFTEFPGEMAIAATGDVENARKIAQAMSAEMRAVGINMDLTPDLDVNNNPQNPIIGARSFGSDPARVAEFGVAFIEGMQEMGIPAIGKHFPGHGDTAVDSHVSLPTVPYDRARLESIEFVPFKAAIRASVAGIMSAHITFPAIDPTPGLAATLSPKALTGLLRDEWEYDGVLMTDELGMGAIATSGYPPPRAAVAALAAGADILLFQRDIGIHRQVQKELLVAVKSGEVSLARLDQAVRRVLLLKQHYGLLLNQAAFKVEPEAVGRETTKRLAREIAARSITLVRDEAHLLPLAVDIKPLVVETGAFGLGKRLGATTMQVAAQPKAGEIASVLAAAQEGRTVLVATSDVAKNRQQVELVNALVKARVPLIVIALRTPYDAMYLQDIPTYLVTYGAPPPSLDALVDVLQGRAQAQGHLPVDMPESR